MLYTPEEAFETDIRQPLILENSNQRTTFTTLLKLFVTFVIGAITFTTCYYSGFSNTEIPIGVNKLPKIVAGTLALCGGAVGKACEVTCAPGFELQCVWDSQCNGACNSLVDYMQVESRECSAPAPPPSALEIAASEAKQSKCCTCHQLLGPSISKAIDKRIKNAEKITQIHPAEDRRRPEYFDDGGNMVFAPPPVAMHPPPLHPELYVKAPPPPTMHHDSLMEPPWPMDSWGIQHAPMEPPPPMRPSAPNQPRAAPPIQRNTVLLGNEEMSPPNPSPFNPAPSPPIPNASTRHPSTSSDNASENSSRTIPRDGGDWGSQATHEELDEALQFLEDQPARSSSS